MKTTNRITNINRNKREKQKHKQKRIYDHHHHHIKERGRRQAPFFKTCLTRDVSPNATRCLSSCCATGVVFSATAGFIAFAAKRRNCGAGAPQLRLVEAAWLHRICPPNQGSNYKHWHVPKTPARFIVHKHR